MVKFPSFSLFTRLYFIIAITVIVSGSASFYFMEKVHLQTNVDDYVYFTNHIYRILLKQNKIPPNSQKEAFDTAVHELDGFLISWQIKSNVSPPCKNCNFVGSSEGVKVYVNLDEQFISVYKLPGNVSGWLLISENNLFSFDERDIGTEEEMGTKEEIREGMFSEYPIDENREVALIFIVLVSLVSVIYWPIRKIQRQIDNLIDVQRQFGAGDLAVRANSSFNKPLDELASSFNTMATSITETVNENQIFAQAVPHEVRTPLSRIQMAVGLLTQNNTNKHHLELLENIDTYIDDMSVLINQVVAFSKVNATIDKNEEQLFQTINVKAFIEERLKLLQCDEQLCVKRDIDDVLTLTTNPTYLRLLVDNLLKNACIHGESQIVICGNSNNGHVEFSIEDDGSGIPQDYIDTIFLPFARADASRSRKTGGLGLGLSIAKSACKRMNARLTVTNTSQGGAKFTCYFFAEP